MNTMMFGFPVQYLSNIWRQLAKESDRGRLLLAGICIEDFLTAKFMNSGLRRKTLAQMLKQSLREGWIDEDVFHDAEIIRKLRNRCAHDARYVDISAEDIRESLELFQVPKRRYFDWRRCRAAATPNGFVFYNGERPSDAVEDLYFPGVMTFSLAIAVILQVVAANLAIPFATKEPGTAVVIELPDFMRLEN